MSISRQNLTVIIVTLKSEHIIDQCIQSIDDDISIIVIENSNNKNFKDYIEKKYRNVSCILSNDNIGMGAGNNIGIENAKSDFVLILNPDVILFENTINELINEANNLIEFAIMSPISDNENFPNYSIKEMKNINYEMIFEVDSVDGFCMLINKKKIKLISKDGKTFDENFFMYLENDDLCKRVKKNNEKIYIVPTCKVKHFGAKGVSENYLKEVELSRNWHWSWSKFYFSKKTRWLFICLVERISKIFIIYYKMFFLLYRF